MVAKLSELFTTEPSNAISSSRVFLPVPEKRMSYMPALIRSSPFCTSLKALSVPMA